MRNRSALGWRPYGLDKPARPQEVLVLPRPVDIAIEALERFLEVVRRILGWTLRGVVRGFRVGHWAPPVQPSLGHPESRAWRSGRWSGDGRESRRRCAAC